MKFNKQQSVIVDILVLAVTIGFLGVYGTYFIDYNGGKHSLLGIAWAIWNSNDGDWEHCMFVPLISIGIVAWRHKELMALTWQPSHHAIWILLLGFLFYWIGFRAEVQYIGYFSLQTIILAWIFWVGGKVLFKELFFPWVFLGFMWPLVFLDNMLAFPLRIIMSDLAYQILNIIGIESIRQGTAILSAADPLTGLKSGERFAVDIANPCSGIRSLFALMMVSALYAYFAIPSVKYFAKFRSSEATDSIKAFFIEIIFMFIDNWKRWFIFAASMPLAVAGNLARIMMLTFGTMLFGPDFAIGTLEDPSTFHMFAGYVVFVVALGGMVAIGFILNLNWKNVFRKVQSSSKKSDKTSSEY